MVASAGVDVAKVRLRWSGDRSQAVHAFWHSPGLFHTFHAAAPAPVAHARAVRLYKPDRALARSGTDRHSGASSPLEKSPGPVAKYPAYCPQGEGHAGQAPFSAVGWVD